MTQHCKPFDLEAFRAGAPHATRGGERVQYVYYATEDDFPNVSGNLRLLVYDVETKSVRIHTHEGQYFAGGHKSHSDLVQVPFCTHDGTPLFYGDKLWSPSWGDVVVRELVGHCVYFEGYMVPLKDLQWEKPAPTRRVEAFDMPTPVTTQPCCGTTYWTFYMEGTSVSACSRIWEDRGTDYNLFYTGVIYPDKETALAAGRAVLTAITFNVSKKD